MRAEMIDAALRLRPTATAADVSVIGEGQLTVATLVDGIVLRFPRSEFARERLRFEVRVLEVLGPQIDHSLPRVVVVELDAPLARAFVAHRFLPGSVLTPDVVRSSPGDRLAAIADETASFLRALHSVTVDNVDIPRLPNQDFAQTLLDEALRFLRPRLKDERWSRVEAELDALGALTTVDLALCHTDIGGNVLYDAASGAVSFIDFGSVLLADPVLDVASLSVLGPRFTALCAETYPVIGERLHDAEVVRGTFHLQDALYGARQGDWRYVDDVLSTY